jgi:8-oxo-dGTP pyrophosphatase MutT (NUDIX family)
VQRSQQSAFLGGAVVFPGGKVDAHDHDPSWEQLATLPAHRRSEAFDRASYVAACRETIEEAGILATSPLRDPASIAALRQAIKTEPFASALRTRGLQLDLGDVLPFARWVTPEAETRRFDTKFFVLLCPEAQEGAHDDHETIRSFWATPAEVLRGFLQKELALFPPTHRSLEVLSTLHNFAEVRAYAQGANLDPICPVLVRTPLGSATQLALALPGDPAHPIPEPRVPGLSRYVLQDDQWLPAAAPST